MDENSGDGHHRSSKRSLVLLAAKLKSAKGIVEVRLRNLSQNGALLEAETPPPVGSEVVFERGETIVDARVAWVSPKSNRFGIEFLQSIEESEVLIHVGRPQPKPDAGQQVFRRTGFHRNALSADEQKIGAAWAQPPGQALGE